jgi:hypothetical protein
MVTVGPKPHQEAALGPGPSLGRVDAGAQQRPAGAKAVHPSGPLAEVRREFSVSRRVASPRQYRTHSVARQWDSGEIGFFLHPIDPHLPDPPAKGLRQGGDELVGHRPTPCDPTETSRQAEGL